MPIYRSFAEFSKECSGFENSLRRAMFQGVNAAAFVTKKAIVAGGPSQKGPTRSAKGRRRPVVVVKYDVAAAAGSRSVNPTAIVRLVNGSMYEFGANKHEIVPKRRRTGAKNALVVPYGKGFFARVEHPGFRGRPFWHRGVETAAPKVQAVFGGAVVDTLRKSFTLS